MNPIHLHLNKKTYVLQIIRETENIILEIDSAGNVEEITEEMLNEKEKLPVVLFEHDLEHKLLLTEEQRIALYDYWGVTPAIMSSRTANAVKIDIRVAKAVIALAEGYKLLLSGWNSTWKIRDTVIKDRWSGIAKTMTQDMKPERKELSVAEMVERNQKQIDAINLMKEKPVSSPIPNEEESVEVIPEEPIQKNTDNIPLLRTQLTKLQAQHDDSNFIESETEDRGTLRDKMKVLKVQITNAEIQQSSSHFDSNKGIKLTPSGSITNITEFYQQKEGAKTGEPIKSLEPNKQRITGKSSKGKSSKAKGVRASKKPVTR